MTWNTIVDFASTQVVRAETFQDIWANLYILKDPMYARSEPLPGPNTATWTYSNTSVFADIDPTYYQLTFESYGNDLLLVAFVTISHSVANGVGFLTFELDGVTLGNDNGLYRNEGNGEGYCLAHIASAVAGNHSLALQWKNGTAGNFEMYKFGCMYLYVMEF